MLNKYFYKFTMPKKFLACAGLVLPLCLAQNSQAAIEFSVAPDPGCWEVVSNPLPSILSDLYVWNGAYYRGVPYASNPRCWQQVVDPDPLFVDDYHFHDGHYYRRVGEPERGRGWNERGHAGDRPVMERRPSEARGQEHMPPRMERPENHGMNGSRPHGEPVGGNHGSHGGGGNHGGGHR